MDMYLNAEGELDYTYTDSAFNHYSIEAIYSVRHNILAYGMKRTGVAALIGVYNFQLLEVFVDLEKHQIFHCSKATKDTLKRVKPIKGV